MTISVAEINYSCISDWADMSLAKAKEISKIEMPERLKKLYNLYSIVKDDQREKDIETLISEITDEDTIKTFPTYYGQVIQAMTNIPEELINKLDGGNRVVFYDLYCKKFVHGLMFTPDFEPQHIQSFTHNGTEYFLPIAKKVLGEIRPMADRTAIEFAESSDLELFSREVEGGRYDRLGNIIAILCRPKISGFIEKYNEDVCLKRAETFDDLTMDIVWEVFFCCAQQVILFNQNIVISFLEETLKEQRRERPAELILSDGTA